MSIRTCGRYMSYRELRVANGRSDGHASAVSGPDGQASAGGEERNDGGGDTLHGVREATVHRCSMDVRYMFDRFAIDFRLLSIDFRSNKTMKLQRESNVKPVDDLADDDETMARG